MPTPIRQLESLTSYPADGVTTAWNFSFSSGYLDQSHVKAYKLATATGVRTEIPVTPAMFLGPNQLSITPAVAAGYELTIYRSTPTDAPLVDFTDRAAFTETSMDTAIKQAVFAAAETVDALSVASERIDTISTLVGNANTYAANAAASASAASTSAGAAATSATNASTSESNAAGSAAAAAASAASVNDANLVHKATAETITGVKTFSAAPVLNAGATFNTVAPAFNVQPTGLVKATVGLGNVDNTSDVNKPVSTAQATAIGAIFAYKNKLRNGSFAINQRAVSGSVVLAAGSYGHDGWKAGASGCTYTFAASGNRTIITISAGSLMQVVEGPMVEAGQYILSNAGTAQARVAVNGAATSGAYATAPITTASATSGQTITVEFSTGTLDLVQLEPGTAATSFDKRPFAAELALCQRYFEKSYDAAIAFGTASVAGSHQSTATTAYFLGSGSVYFKVPKRTSTLSMGLCGPATGAGASASEYNSGSTFVAERAAAVSYSNMNSFEVQISGVATAGMLYRVHWYASAEL